MATIRLDDDGVEVLDEDGERLLTRGCQVFGVNVLLTYLAFCPRT